MVCLKPCPFCGANAFMTHAMGEYWVTCDQCEAGTAMSVYEVAAAENWNHRTGKSGYAGVMICGGTSEEEIALIDAIKATGSNGILIVDDTPHISLGLESHRFELPERYAHIKMPKESNSERCGYSTKRK